MTIFAQLWNSTGRFIFITSHTEARNYVYAGSASALGDFCYLSITRHYGSRFKILPCHNDHHEKIYANFVDHEFSDMPIFMQAQWGNYHQKPVCQSDFDNIVRESVAAIIDEGVEVNEDSDEHALGVVEIPVVDYAVKFVPPKA